MAPDGVLASWRHQRREAGHEVVDVVSIFEAERHRPVPPWVPQRKDDAVLTADAQAGQGDGWAQDVPAKSLKPSSSMRSGLAACFQTEVAISRFVPLDSPVAASRRRVEFVLHVVRPWGVAAPRDQPR